MSIDISRLSPWAQRQIAEKQLALQQKENKYHAQRVERGEKLRFDSKKEARRYDELMLLLKAGKISELKLQPQFTLQESFLTPEGKRIRAIRYAADFSYRQDGELVVEDVKSEATRKLRTYQIKRKLLQEKHGITVREV